MPNAQLMHHLLKYPKIEIGTLVRMNVVGHPKLCETYGKNLDNHYDLG